MIWKCCLLCLISGEFNEEKSVIILLLRQCCYYQAVEELREIWISHSFWQEDGQLVYFWLTSEEFLRFSLLCCTTEYLIFIDFNFEEKKKDVFRLNSDDLFLRSIFTTLSTASLNLWWLLIQLTYLYHHMNE